MADPSKVLSQADLWAAALCERGLVDEATAKRLTETLTASRGERLDRENDPLLVAILCGPTAVGKSTLINALAGAEISRQGLGATTDAAVLYVHERDDPDRLFEYSQGLGRAGQEETTLVRHHRNELLHKVLVDTPDIDSVMLQHRETTAGLVHAADLVLFVTSPEKYKAMRSARWILEQRQQRAIAFVLNKWDSQALGLQRDRRQELLEDFRAVLANEGYPDALIFKVSSLTRHDSGGGMADIENDLPALRAWLETGITRSTAAVIQQRRLRAAWGRLSSAIERALPPPLSKHPLLPDITARLASSGTTAAEMASVEASGLELAGLEDSGWPATPGLLGMWRRLYLSITTTTTALKATVSTFTFAAAPDNPPAGSGSRHFHRTGFGAATSAGVSNRTLQLVDEASAAQLPFGSIAAVWTAETAELARQLAVLPLDVATIVSVATRRRWLRRWTGSVSLYALEALIAAVLFTAVGRVGIAFVQGSDAPNGLFITAAELILALLVIAHGVAAMFFPPLRQRVRRLMAQRARALVKTATERQQLALREHVEAVDRLAQQGRDLLGQIDRIVAGLTTSKPQDGEDVERLFGVAEGLRLPDPVTARLPMPASGPGEAVTQRRPTFD